MNVGIIGAGFFGDKHATAVHACDEFELVAASRTDRRALATFVERYGGTPYDDYRELLADDRVDAVVIATPHATHREIAVAAARAGKHVLLEKPMAVTLEECDAILAAAEEAGVTLMVGHVTHFSPAFKTAKAMLDAGEVGEIVAGLSTMRKRWFEPNRRDWHLDRAEGGGVLMTGGIHAVDRLGWLVGSEVFSVAAHLATRFHRQSADDTGVLFLRYVDGTVGTVYSIGYDTGAPEHGTELTCTRGIIRVHSVHGVSIGRGEAWTTVPDTGHAAWMNEALVSEWQAFERAIREQQEPAVPGRFARHVMATLFAAEESSRTHAEVRVTGI